MLNYKYIYVAFSLLVIACNPDPPTPPSFCLDCNHDDSSDEISCLDEGCEDGFVCASGESGVRCLSQCDSPGSACESGGQCVEVTGSEEIFVCYQGEAQPGHACYSDAECMDGSVCVRSSTSESGLCQATCDDVFALCSGGEVCLPTQAEGQGICYAGGEVQEGDLCESSAECGYGLRCMGSADGDRICVRACVSETECKPGQSCEGVEINGESSGAICRPMVGAACASSSVCADGLTCSTGFEDPFFFANLWPAGVCTQASCLDDSSCPDGSVCRDVGTSSGALSVCAPGCDSDADCRVSQGWRCLDVSSCSEGASGCQKYFADTSICARPDRLWVLQ